MTPGKVCLEEKLPFHESTRVSSPKKRNVVLSALVESQSLERCLDVRAELLGREAEGVEANGKGGRRWIVVIL